MTVLAAALLAGAAVLVLLPPPARLRRLSPAPTLPAGAAPPAAHPAEPPSFPRHGAGGRPYDVVPAEGGSVRFGSSRVGTAALAGSTRVDAAALARSTRVDAAAPSGSPHTHPLSVLSGLTRAAAAAVLAVVVAVAATGWLVGLSPGAAAVPAVVAGALVLRRRARAAGRSTAERRRKTADLPALADLLAACLAAGARPVEALSAVCEDGDGPLVERLQTALARHRLGADPALVWAELAGDPVLRPVGRALARTARTGAPAAALLIRVAEDARRQRAAHRRAAARRVGVRATLPVGLCFLPAFVALGVVPTVVGLTAGVVQP